jgi:hypothetical protein
MRGSRKHSAETAAFYEPAEHSVYVGRHRLGRYSRAAVDRYAAFGVDDRPLGGFADRLEALAAIDRAATGIIPSATPEAHRQSARRSRKTKAAS